MTDAKKAGLLSPVAAIVKIVQDMDALYEHTLVDPNADDPYLRGYTNGIRLMHATLHSRDPDFVEEPLQPAPSSSQGLAELPPVPLVATADGRAVPDRSRLSLYLDDLKPRHTNEFERRLLVILDVLINDRR